METLEEWKIAHDCKVRATEEAFAAVKKIEGFDREALVVKILSELRCPALHMGWAMDRFWGRQVAENIMPSLAKLYAKFVDLGVDYENRHVFNVEDRMFFCPHPDKAIICHEMSSRNMLYVWEKNSPPRCQRLHIRFYFKRREIVDDWDREEEDNFKKKVAATGYEAAIIAAGHLAENYADDYTNCGYPSRLSLTSYLAKNFEMKYGDCRDEGYVATWDEMSCVVDRSYYNHSVLELVTTCFLPYMMETAFRNT